MRIHLTAEIENHQRPAHAAAQPRLSLQLPQVPARARKPPTTGLTFAYLDVDLKSEASNIGVTPTSRLTGFYWKLTEADLRALVSAADAERILTAAAERKPNKVARNMVSVPLNKPGTIRVQNVHFYGGENFGEPYHFPAEITCATTASAFSRFIRRRGLRLRIPFTY